MVVQHFRCRKMYEVICRVPGNELSPSSSVKILTLCLLQTNVQLSDVLSVGTMTKFSWSDNTGAQKMDSRLVFTECISCRILRFRTSAIDLIYSERVSTSTSSFLAHRLAFFPHRSMMNNKVLVPWVWDSFPIFMTLPQKISKFNDTCDIEITCH